MERWADIRGFEGKYQVSDEGRVLSLARTIKTKNSYRTYRERFLNPGLATNGYLVVNLSVAGIIVQRKIHRLVAEAFLGLSNLHVNHKDLNKTNNTLSNLEYVTAYQNALHAVKNGARVGRTKLTALDRKEIRSARKNGSTLRELAEKYGVLQSAISEVYRGITWSWE